jgi:hypothetical protein
MNIHVWLLHGTGFSFLYDKCSRVQLVGQIEIKCLVLQEAVTPFSRMNVLFYIPTSYVGGTLSLPPYQHLVCHLKILPSC